jgi:nitrous oxide reductase accessory protein NosL
MNRSLGMLALLALPMLAACDWDDLNGPPTLRLGRDECAECGMAILVEQDGRRDYLLFDDIGCLVDLERAREGELRVVGRFVHDHNGGGWTAGDTAVYLVTDGSTLRTPMASGLAAFADKAGAERGQTRYGGEVRGFSGLVEARRAWAETRRKSSGG